ncbi:MAG TPA: FtsX-like permease family protein, partial [Solirubrobacteraceae bacterium]|nr:FtsX-like permease family protein [Solirubrobacteraceae bacterium]
MVESVNGLAVRQLRTRPLRSLLTGFGIVLGVGMVFGVLLLSGAIRTSFDEIFSSIWGTKDLIVAPRGGLLPDRTLDAIRDTPGVRSAAPMVGATVVRLDASGRPIHGTKGQVNLGGWSATGPQPYDYTWAAGRAARGADEVAVEQDWARDRHLGVGDTLSLGTPSGRRTLRITGILALSGGFDFGGLGYAVMALGPARRLLDMPHGWLQVTVGAKDRGAVDRLQARLRARLGSGADVQTPGDYSDQVKRQLQALDTILYFFAGVALFVGGFLILNSFTMTVAQRIREIGTLRTLGATRRTVRRSVMTEAAALGVVGSVLGLGLGVGLAAGLIVGIRGLGIPVQGIHVSAGDALVAVALGLVATAAGAWWPARRAARVAPVRAARDAA